MGVQKVRLVPLRTWLPSYTILGRRVSGTARRTLSGRWDIVVGGRVVGRAQKLSRALEAAGMVAVDG